MNSKIWQLIGLSFNTKRILYIVNEIDFLIVAIFVIYYTRYETYIAHY